MAISKLSGVDWANVANVSGIDAANIGNVMGIERPASVAFVTNNLIGWWDPLEWDTATETRVPDLAYENGYSTQDHSLAASNGATKATVDGTSVLVTDGVNDYFSTNQYSVYGTSDTFYINTLLEQTVEMWFRSNGSFINNGNLWGAAYNGGVRCRFSSSGILYFIIRSGSFSAGWQASTDTWYHVVFTMTDTANDEAAFYVNGSLVTNDTDIGGYLPSYVGGTLLFGTYNSTSERGRFYYGPIRRYNRPLTAQEVSQNFDAEKARFGY